MRVFQSRRLSWRNKHFLIAAGVFLLINTCAQGSMISDDLVKVGKQYYDAARYQEAIHELSKALLVDPGNETALLYLEKMGLDGGIYSYYTTPIDRIYQLAEEINGYHRQLEQLEQERATEQQHARRLEQQKQQLHELIARKEEEKKMLEEVQAAASMKMQEQQEEIASLEEQTQAKTEALITLNTDLFEAKERLRTDREALAAQEQRLAEVQSTLDQHLKSSAEELRMTALEYEKTLAELQKQRDQLEHEHFKTQDKYRENAHRFNTIVRKKDAEIALGENHLAIRNYQVATQQKQLETLRKEISVLRQQKKELQDEAFQLQAQIREAQKEQTFRYASVEKPSPSVPDHVRYQDQMIMDLKMRLVELTRQVTALKEGGQKKDEKLLIQMQAELESLKRRIREKEKDIDFAGEQQEILENRIKDYQERLSIVEEMIKDRELRIQLLEEQIGLDVN